MPAAIGPDLIAISAELHYLRVRTPMGSDPVLYSFGAAIDELRDAPGMQVHRSHWVMLAHVRAIERVGQRGLCHVSDGTRIPVSRSYRAALEQAVSDLGSTGAQSRLTGANGLVRIAGAPQVLGE
ncbi:MAG: LytTR family DNA-binding domain-containing protein [Pseudomonadota bacterium]